MMALSIPWRRHLPFALTLLTVMALSAAPAFAQGPAPWTTLSFNLRDFLVIIVCPLATLVMAVLAIFSMTSGHHGSYGQTVVYFFAAAAFASITTFTLFFSGR
jgi:hypothetical protein